MKINVFFSFNGYDLLMAKHVKLTIVASYTQKCCFFASNFDLSTFHTSIKVMLGYLKYYIPNIYYLTQVKILWKVTLLIEEFDKQSNVLYNMIRTYSNRVSSLDYFYKSFKYLIEYIKSYIEKFYCIKFIEAN